jgi:hypothetical protein
MSYYDIFVRWAQSDVTAKAYELTYSRSRRPEHLFLIEQLRVAATIWQDALKLEERHMQQRMPRV